MIMHVVSRYCHQRLQPRSTFGQLCPQRLSSAGADKADVEQVRQTNGARMSIRETTGAHYHSTPAD